MAAIKVEELPSTLRVAARVRPPQLTELEQPKFSNIVNVSSVKKQVSVSSDNAQKVNTYEFDYVFDENSNQEDIFTQIGLPMLQFFNEGRNVSLLAFGPTGSGKTYTMGTDATEFHPQNSGIIPRILRGIFEEANEEYSLSFLEIYNEEIRDLLSKGKDIPLAIRTDGDKVSVPCLKTCRVSCWEAALELLKEGSLKRVTGRTDSNTGSSRSHAILTLRNSRSKMMLVDLAGSESVAKAGVSGVQFNEGIHINTGLLALGKVMNALAEQHRSGKSGVHINYRDSILTRLLQECLNGNSITQFVTCVSPCAADRHFTLNSLRYAQDARMIKTKAIQNSLYSNLGYRTPFKVLALNTQSIVTPQGSKFVKPFSSSIARRHQFKRIAEDDSENDIFNGSSTSTLASVMSVSDLGSNLADVSKALSPMLTRKLTEALGDRDKYWMDKMDDMMNIFKNKMAEQQQASRQVKKAKERAVDSVTSEPSDETFIALNQTDRRRSLRLLEKSMNQSSLNSTVDSSINCTVTNRTRSRRKLVSSDKENDLPALKSASKKDQKSYASGMLKFLNTATLKQLQQLPTVGPKAALIIDKYRTVNRGLKSLEDLKELPYSRKNFYDNFMKSNQLA